MKFAGRLSKRWGSSLNPLSSILDPAILNPSAQTSRPFPSLRESADRVSRQVHSLLAHGVLSKVVRVAADTTDADSFTF